MLGRAPERAYARTREARTQTPPPDTDASVAAIAPQLVALREFTVATDIESCTQLMFATYQDAWQEEVLGVGVGSLAECASADAVSEHTIVRARARARAHARARSGHARTRQRYFLACLASSEPSTNVARRICADAGLRQCVDVVDVPDDDSLRMFVAWARLAERYEGVRVDAVEEATKVVSNVATASHTVRYVTDE